MLPRQSEHRRIGLRDTIDGHSNCRIQSNPHDAASWTRRFCYSALIAARTSGFTSVSSA
jgi:hypothetical protein